MKNINLIFSMHKRLRRYSQELGLSYTADVSLTGYSKAYTQIEDGKPVKYSEMFDVRIESRSNYFFSYLPKLGKLVPEGRYLDKRGAVTIGSVYKKIRKELREHAIATGKLKPKVSNVIKFRGAK